MKKFINSYKKWNPSTYALILVLLIPLIIFIMKGFALDNDFWFLINTGKTIIKEGFINIETFTIHSGLSFIPQQWLTDVLFSLIYDSFGIKGMFYLVILCDGILVFLLYKLCYLVNNNKKRSLIITTFANCFLMWSGLLTTRPQLFDGITFTLELYLLELFIQKDKDKYLYFIPLLSILLINYHASMWFMLFVLLIPYYLEYFIKKDKSFKIKPLIIVTILSLLGGFINPYGIEAIKYLFNSYGVEKINNFVIEMRSVSISGFIGIIIFIIIFILLLSFYHNKGNNKIRYTLLSLGIIYLSLSHYKGAIFLGILMPLILGYNLQKNSVDKEYKLGIVDKIVYVIGIIIISSLVIFKTEMKDEIVIKEFADYLDQNASFDIKLFTEYNTGSYMEYRGYKCYIDPRAEVFLKKNNHVEDIFDEYYYLSYGTLDPKEFLEKYQFDYLLVTENTSILLYELKNNDLYQEVLNNDKYYLYKKVG